jgi:hypothetical protein
MAHLLAHLLLSSASHGTLQFLSTLDKNTIHIVVTLGWLDSQQPSSSFIPGFSNVLWWQTSSFGVVRVQIVFVTTRRRLLSMAARRTASNSAIGTTTTTAAAGCCLGFSSSVIIPHFGLFGGWNEPTGLVQEGFPQLDGFDTVLSSFLKLFGRNLHNIFREES